MLFYTQTFSYKIVLAKKVLFSDQASQKNKSTMKRYRFRSRKRKYSSKNSQTCLPAWHQNGDFADVKMSRVTKCLGFIINKLRIRSTIQGLLLMLNTPVNIYVTPVTRTYFVSSSLLLTTERTVTALNECTVKLSKLKMCTVSM